mgnify:CR=1 FL=1
MGYAIVYSDCIELGCKTSEFFYLLFDYLSYFM